MSNGVILANKNSSYDNKLADILPLLRCPQSGEPLKQQGNKLISVSGEHVYRIDDAGIPLFAEQLCSEEASIQKKHYDQIADAYTANLQYPHTIVYMSYLDNALKQVIPSELGTCAEICCGTGEAISLFKNQIAKGIGVDISSSMLRKGRSSINSPHLYFTQGDATQLPLQSAAFDSVIMLGGIHHVPDRKKLFAEIYRILKPGGVFIWREPVSDFWLWKLLRSIIYKLSPMLDHSTERPLTYNETVPVLNNEGFIVKEWKTYGFIGFCLLMNSDVLIFNRYFRFIPGIRAITRGFTHFDSLCTKLPGLQQAGLQVVGRAVKPTDRATHD